MILKNLSPHCPFAQIPNEMIEDSRLSFHAKGVLVYLLSKPPHWKPIIADIAKHSNDSEHLIRKALKELQEHGYARLIKVKDEQGHWGGSEWHICNNGAFSTEIADYGISVKRSLRILESPQSAISISNTETPSNTETESNRDNTPLAKARFVKPTIEELRSYVQEQQMPIVEAERFMNYYEANGWRVGKNPMKCWRAAVRNWKGNWKSRRFQNQGAAPAMQKPEKSDWLMGNDELAMPEAQ